MDEFTLQFIRTFVAIIAISIPFLILLLKSNKTKDKILKSLEIGQQKIFSELKGLNTTMIDMKKEHDVLFEHKEDCLNHRTNCAKEYMTHEDYDRLQNKKCG